MHDADFREQGRELLRTISGQYVVDPGARDLFDYFFGLGPWLDRPLGDLRVLREINCLTNKGRHVKFTLALLWAYCDPEAREWIHPRFFTPSSTD